MSTNFSLFYQLPVLVIGALFMVMLLIALESGYRIGFYQRKKWKNADSGGGTVALSSMFALLGLILAFTYASGVSRFEDRKQSVVNEANALGTAFLRSGLIEEPEGRILKEKILAYAKTRVVPRGTVLSDAQRLDLLNKTLLAKEELWPTLEQILRKKKPGAIEASLVAAINDVLDEFPGYDYHWRFGAGLIGNVVGLFLLPASNIMLCV